MPLNFPQSLSNSSLIPIARSVHPKNGPFPGNPPPPPHPPSKPSRGARFMGPIFGSPWNRSGPVCLQVVQNLNFYREKWGLGCWGAILRPRGGSVIWVVLSYLREDICRAPGSASTVGPVTYVRSPCGSGLRSAPTVVPLARRYKDSSGMRCRRRSGPGGGGEKGDSHMNALHLVRGCIEDWMLPPTTKVRNAMGMMCV